MNEYIRQEIFEYSNMFEYWSHTGLLPFASLTPLCAVFPVRPPSMWGLPAQPHLLPHLQGSHGQHQGNRHGGCRQEYSHRTVGFIVYMKGEV